MNDQPSGGFLDAGREPAPAWKRYLLVYVAGRYRGANAWEVQRNIMAAREASLAIWRMGAVAICPHALTANFDGILPDSVWLAGDLEVLYRCDAGFLVDGWRDSVGTRREVEFAVEHGIPLFEQFDVLKDWLTRAAGGGIRVRIEGRNQQGKRNRELP